MIKGLLSEPLFMQGPVRKYFSGYNYCAVHLFCQQVVYECVAFLPA
jgi:hypothetical protein